MWVDGSVSYTVLSFHGHACITAATVVYNSNVGKVIGGTTIVVVFCVVTCRLLHFPPTVSSSLV